MDSNPVQGKTQGLYFTNACNQNGELILNMVVDTMLDPMLEPNITFNQLLIPVSNGRLLG